ncbi:MAG: hypothetical protein MUC84_07245 [Solirubrobacteraceae bacterium]|jgi:hypothetical protein|nr:hypothetical protein [Solirubrobacteraceae bacterium]
MSHSLRVQVVLIVTLALAGACGPAAPPPRGASAPASAPASRPAAGRPAAPPDVFGSGFGPARDAREVVAKLQALRAAAVSPEERHLLDRLAAAMLQLEPAATRAAGFRELLAVVRAWGQLYADDFETQLKVASTIAVLAEQAATLDLPAAPLRQERVDLARRLVARFPGQARAHGQLGWVLRLAGADPFAVLPHYARCLDLEAGNAVCRRAYDALAEEIRQPRCTTVQVHPGLALHGASPTPAPGRRSVEWRGQKLHLEAEPLVGAAGFAEVSAGPRELEVRLTPAAARAFAAGTGRLAAAGGSAVLLRDGRVLMAARVMSAIEGGRLRLADFRLDDLCQRVERREVPPALRR